MNTPGLDLAAGYWDAGELTGVATDADGVEGGSLTVGIDEECSDLERAVEGDLVCIADEACDLRSAVRRLPVPTMSSVTASARKASSRPRVRSAWR
jgi:hypothetical protein